MKLPERPRIPKAWTGYARPSTNSCRTFERHGSSNGRAPSSSRSPRPHKCGHGGLPWPRRAPPKWAAQKRSPTPHCQTPPAWCSTSGRPRSPIWFAASCPLRSLAGWGKSSPLIGRLRTPCPTMFGGWLLFLRPPRREREGLAAVLEGLHAPGAGEGASLLRLRFCGRGVGRPPYRTANRPI